MKMVTVLSMVILGVCNWLLPMPVNHLEVEGMDLSYLWVQDSLELTLKAPTEGWLLLGFHTEDNIVGADLKAFCVQDGVGKWEDQFASSAWVHPKDTDLGGKDNIRLVQAKEITGMTEVTFRLPRLCSDAHDVMLRPNRPIWLILAYADSDNFSANVRVRKHVKVLL